MKQNIKDINRINNHKKYFLKKELKLKILKSIIQNKNVKPVLRLFIQFKYLKFLKHKKINTLKKICLNTGKKNSIFNFCNLSRQSITKFNKFIKLTNIKLKSW